MPNAAQIFSNDGIVGIMFFRYQEPICRYGCKNVFGKSHPLIVSFVNYTLINRHILITFIIIILTVFQIGGRGRMRMSTCTFFGHRDCPESAKLTLLEVVRNLIANKDVDHFYVDNHRQFNACIHQALIQL